MTWGKVPLGEVRERQGRKLHRFLTRKVYPYSPFYKRMFDALKLNPERIRRVEDLKYLPFTTKADLAPTADNPDRFREFIIQPSPEQLKDELTITDKIALFAKSQLYLRSIHDQVLDEYLPVHTTFTTGRTAQPTPFVYTLHDIEITRECGRRLFQAAGLDRRHDRGLNAMPFAPHIAFWQVVHAGLAVGLLLLHSGGGKGLGTEAILRLGVSGKPTVLIGTPGYIMHLAHAAEDGGFRIDSIRKVIVGAERAGPEYKQKLREQLAKIGSPNVTVQSVYGFTEAKRAWMESADAPDCRYLTYPDFEIFEIIDPHTGELVPEGAPGEIVYTYIAGSGTIVLRYRTGDMVKEGLIHAQCPYSGLLLPLLGRTISRVSEIKKVKETLVDFNELFAYFNAQPEIVDWQLVIAKTEGEEYGRDVLTLRVALGEGTDSAVFEERLRREFKAQTEIALDSVEYMSRGALSLELGLDTLPKESRILDKRPK
jgi:phenylacetate-CoA ligase